MEAIWESPNVVNGDTGAWFRNVETIYSATGVARSAEEVLDMLTWVGNNSTVLAIISLQVLVI